VRVTPDVLQQVRHEWKRRIRMCYQRNDAHTRHPLYIDRPPSPCIETSVTPCNDQLLAFLSQAGSHILVNIFLLKCFILNNYSLRIQYFIYAVLTIEDDTILRNTSVTAYGPDSYW
jgi:hypothetical protein